MTLGMKISHYRKELGLSQESLGEQLGVSRQAISKWEADAAIPEIDKLIALSKLFSVPVGQLLGVEEPPPEQDTADDGELTEKQEQMIEEIVSRYVAAMPKPKKMSGWKKLAIAGLVIAAGWYVISMNDRISSMQNSLSNQINNIQGSTSTQINSISTRLEEIMEQGASILLSGEAWLKDYDPDAGNYTIHATVAPKELWENAECWFIIRNSEDPLKYVEQQVTEERAGTFTCDMSWPEEYGDDVIVSVEFREDGLTRVEGINYFQELSAYGRCFCIPIWADFVVGWGEDQALSIRIDDLTATLFDGVDENYDNYALPTPYLEFFRNGELLTTHELDMTDYQGEVVHCRDILTGLSDEPLQEGDVFGVFLRMVDQYGRESRTFLAGGVVPQDTSSNFALLENHEFREEFDNGAYDVMSSTEQLPQEIADRFADGNSDLLHRWG